MLRWLASLMVLTTAAAGAPRVVPFLPTPGIQLAGNVSSMTFCSASQRAVLRLDNNAMLSVDAAGTVRDLGKLLPGTQFGTMTCDAKDRIYIASGMRFAIFQNGQTTFEMFAANTIDVRLLADGSLAILDGAGNVTRRDGATTTPLWSANRTNSPTFVMALSVLDRTAEKFVSLPGGRIDVTFKDGTHKLGPAAISATWLDDTTVVFADRLGVVARWAIDAKDTEFYKVDEFPSRATFVRTQLYRAGKRIIADRSDGFIRTLTVDGGVASVSAISRIPLGRRAIAAGDAPFAVITVNDRAFVVDVTRSSQAVEPLLPSGPIDALAFSPDGRELAMQGGDQDIVIAALDRSSWRRITPPTFLRGQLMWLPDRTLMLSNFVKHARFNLDGTVEQRNVRVVGFTPSGNPITVTRDQRIVIDRGQSEQSFPIPDRALSVMRVEVTDRYIIIRSTRRYDIYALDAHEEAPPVRRTRMVGFIREGAFVGTSGVLYIDDSSNLFLADDGGEHPLGRINGQPILAVSADRKRVAIATQNSITIYDERGKQVATFASTYGVIRAIAWSPNLHTLAVAARDGVELWTIPL